MDDILILMTEKAQTLTFEYAVCIWTVTIQGCEAWDVNLST